VIVWLQLAIGTLVVLWPGRAVSRALGVPGAAETFTWSLAVVAAALAVTFAVHGSLTLTLVLMLAAGAVAWPFARRRDEGESHALVAFAGLLFGIALWSIEGVVRGDALFHLARLRKLDDFGSLALRTVDEFKDGGLHPGYAFPLWHGWLALVGKVTGLDPAQVVLHESSLLAPLAFVLAFELGRTIFRSVPMGVATLLAQVGIIALAPGGGGAYRSLELPGTAARQLLVPAATIVFFRLVRRPTWAGAVTLALAAAALSFVHPTYALFLAIVLGGYAAVRLLVVREWRENALALAAFGVPMVLVFLWLKPVVDETVSRDALAQNLVQYRSDLVVHSHSSYHLAAGVVTRTGAIAVAALALAPLAVFAVRRRWAALVLGGTALLLALELSPFLFPHFSDLVSMSQSRRAAGFVPFAVAFAGGLALVPWLLALPAGIALQLAWPGDFGLRLQHGGPAAVAWWALFGCLAAIALARVWQGDRRRSGALAATLFVLPVAVHGFANWDGGSSGDAQALTPGLVHFLRHDVPRGDVVFADLQTSYRIGAYAPVYVANGPPTHVADTRANDPYGRRDALREFLRTGSLAIPRRYGAQWLVLRRGEHVRVQAPLVYRDARYRVYRL
jgi:hypothetical protein